MKMRVFAVCVVVFLFCGITHAGLSDGLVAYYPFNGNANDESGNGNNGIVHGATLTTDRSGNANSAYSFNGIDNYIDTNIPIINTYSGGQITVVFWMYWNGNLAALQSENEMPIGFRDYDIIIHRDGFGFNTANSDLYGTSLSGLANRWVNIAAIFTNGDIKQNKVYIDGVEQSLSQLLAYPIARSVSSNMMISGWPNHIYSVDGKIDDIRVYNRSLSASEVQQLYQGQGVCSSGVVKFTAGTPAKAADVNANFDALNCQMQALKAIVCQDHPTASVCQ
jgi:hypothetical protein